MKGLRRTAAYACLALTGCAVAVSPQTGDRSGTSSPAARLVGDGAATEKAQANGQIFIAIRWPARAVQYIPPNSNSMWIKVSAGDGELLGQEIIGRPDAQSSLISTASLEVKPGTHSVVVRAFADLLPGDFDGSPLAEGTGSAVVHPSIETALSITLMPLGVPTINGFFPAHTGPEALVTVNGSNFTFGSLAVKVGDLVATPSLIQDDSFTLEIPDGASSGFIVVDVDGLTATSSSPLVILSEIALSPAITTGIATGTPVIFTLSATDDAGVAVDDATATLSFGPLEDDEEIEPDPDDATLEGPVFTPVATGAWEIVARSGMLFATASVRTD